MSDAIHEPALSAELPIIADILASNARFVAEGAYEPYRADKYPDRKLAIVACMDTRLTELLPAALGIKNGDANIIKVAGAEVTEPYGAVMRSLLVAVCELRVEDIMVIAHTDCGAQHMSGPSMVEDMRRLGVPDENIEAVRESGPDLDQWLAGFGDAEESIRRSVDAVRNHPLMPPNIRVSGFIMDSETGQLKQVAC